MSIKEGTKCIPLVPYYRVSTKRQGESGLGLEAQEAAFQAYALSVGGKAVKSFVEVESGRKSDRKELAKALAFCKRIKGRLVVAKLDRLARSVAVVSALMESKVDFVAADMPMANRLTIHILAAVAEAEATAISDRTKAALAAKKARGEKLGARPGTCPIPPEARKRGALAAGAAVRSAALEAYSDLIPVLREYLADGMTQQQMADKLNEDHVTRKGCKFTQGHVSRILRRSK